MAINNKYFIVNRVDVTQTMLNECVENSIDDCVHNDTRLRVIIKGREDGSVPSTLSGETSNAHSEITTELDNAEWQDS